MLAALLIFLVTIVLVIWQPRGLGIGWSAMLGAALALLSGVVHHSDTHRMADCLECDGHLYRRYHHQSVAG